MFSGDVHVHLGDALWEPLSLKHLKAAMFMSVGGSCGDIQKMEIFIKAVSPT